MRDDVSTNTVTDWVFSQCSYVHIAQRHQDIHLFTKIKSRIKHPKSVTKVGVVNGIKATQEAHSELLELNPNFNTYSNIYDMIQQHSKGNFDGIVLPWSLMKTPPIFGADWEPVFEFKEKDAATITVSSEIDMAIKKN